METVIGPTPPGTGLIQPATFEGNAEGHVADGLGLAVGAFDAADANVNHDGAGFDHFGGDQARDARGGDEDVGLARERREHGRPLVAGDDRGLLTHEEDGDGLADNVARADDDRDFALEEGGVVFAPADGLKHFDDGQRGAGGEGRAAVDDVADVRRIDALDVLVRIDQALDAVGVDLLRGGAGAS